jgi:hypothetical protein
MMMNSPNEAYAETFKNSPCPVCKGQTFEWGRLARVYYVPGTSLWSSRGLQYISTRRCLQCNHLLSFADQDLTRKQRQIVMPVIIIAILLALLGAILPMLLTLHR